jgi:hypothetical protein
VDLDARLAPLRDIDPDQLSEPQLRELVPRLLAVCEESVTATLALTAEVQHLKDEIARLKGEHGGPRRPPSPRSRLLNPVEEPCDHSSEQERRQREPRPPRKKRCKLDRISINRTVRLEAFPHGLPRDAQFKGWEAVVIQDLVLKTDNVRFLRAKYWSPSRGSFLAALPPGYQGQFGPGVKALGLSLVYGSQMSLPLLHAFLADAGILISRGQVANLVTTKVEPFHAEQHEVLRAGLASTPWQHLDVTRTPVDGESHACHVLANPFYAHYHTTPSQDRLSALDVLRGGAPRRYRLDAAAYAHLARSGVAARVVRALQSFPQDTTWPEAAFRQLLDVRLPRLGKAARADVEEAAALAAYRADPLWPVVQCLLADDAATFRELTRELALCWIHDGRHYKKLLPQFACHRKALERFRQRYWDYYRELLAYREAPSPEEAHRLAAAFDALFATESLWGDLQTCIARTRANKEKLLRVLVHPELPLHNNPAELTARRRVRKRDVSFGPRSPTGLRAWDTFQGLVETTRKLGIRFWDYLQDRLTQGGKIPPLAELIAARAAEQPLGTSWAAA